MSYQVLTPGVRTYLDGREVCDLKCSAGKREYANRTEDMRMRQDFECAICKVWIAPPPIAQFDHQAGRGMFSAHRDDRISIGLDWQNAAVCADCNLRKGSRRYSWQGGLYLPVR